MRKDQDRLTDDILYQLKYFEISKPFHDASYGAEHVAVHVALLAFWVAGWPPPEAFFQPTCRVLIDLDGMAK